MDKKFELIYTWVELKKVQDEIDEIDKRTDAITEERKKSGMDYMRETYNKLWATRHTLEKRGDLMRRQCIPEVGMPCTVHWYSDSSGATVQEVIGKTKKKVVVKCDGLYHCTKVFTYRSNGRWVEQGTTSRDWGTLLHLGYKHDYYDPSF